MRILIFHGYLLRGTGSNIYNASLCRALVGLGHEVHLLCQDRARASSTSWTRSGASRRRARVETVREPVRCTVYLPDIEGVLPVYVADRYEGFEAVTFAELTDERARALPGRQRGGRARRWPSARAPEVALANHLVMGPVDPGRGLEGGCPYAVKVHGSALEYTVRPEPERFLPYAREGLERRAGRAGGLAPHRGEPVGGDRRRRPARAHAARAARRGHRHVPPAPAARGRRAPRGRSPTASRAARRRPGAASAGAADALRALDPARRTDRELRRQADRLEGRRPAAGGLAAGGGERARRAARDRRASATYRDGLERLVGALRRGDLDDAREIARAGGSWRAARRASCATWPPSSTGSRATRARLPRRGAGRGRPRALHRPARARRPARPAARLPGAGRAEHVPGGVRHGGRGGGGLRRAAAVGRPLGHGRGHRHAGAGGRRAGCVRCSRSSAARARSRRSPRSSSSWLALDPAERERAVAALAGARPRPYGWESRGRGRDRRRARRPGRAPGAGPPAAVRPRQRIVFRPVRLSGHRLPAAVAGRWRRYRRARRRLRRASTSPTS